MIGIAVPAEPGGFPTGVALQTWIDLDDESTVTVGRVRDATRSLAGRAAFDVSRHCAPDWPFSDMSVSGQDARVLGWQFGWQRWRFLLVSTGLSRKIENVEFAVCGA